MKLDVYDNIIADVRSLPKRKPRPKPQPMKFTQRVKKVFERKVEDVVADTYGLLARCAMGQRQLEAKIPLSKLQNRIAHHAAIMFARSINRGHFCRVMYADTFLVIFDYGDGRTVEIGAQLYRNPQPEVESLSAIVVKETDMVDPWDKVFHRDEIEFDLVEEIPHNGKEPKIQDAVIWQIDE